MILTWYWHKGLGLTVQSRSTGRIILAIYQWRLFDIVGEG